MIPKEFEYYDPHNIEEVINLLEKYGEEAKILAGGQSLMPLLKMRILSPRCVVDINRVNQLKYIREEEGFIKIGALVRHYEIEYSTLLQSRLPIISRAVGEIGDPLVRNRGTIGGSLCHADPSADLPPVLIAAEAEIKIAGPKGERLIKAENFFIDYMTTVVQPNEVLTEVRLPLLPKHTGGAYFKLQRTYGDFAILNIATLLTLNKDSSCERIRIAMGGVGARPLRIYKAEKLIEGQVIEDRLIEEASEKGVEEIEPPSDFRASSWYRKEVAKVYIKRSIKSALNAARCS